MLKVLLFSILLAGGAFAETIVLDRSGDNAYSLEILNSSEKETVVRFKLHSFNREDSKALGRSVSKISLEGASLTSERGYPEVPRLARDFRIPRGAKVELNVSHINSQKMDLGVISPSKGTIYRNQKPKEISYSFASFYNERSQNMAFPENNVTIRKQFSLRDKDGVTIEINPMMYNSASQKTEIIKELIFSIRTDVADVMMAQRTPKIDVFHKIQDNHFVNSGEFSIEETLFENGSNQVGEKGDLLIISHHSFTSSLSEFVKWKKKMGFNTKLVDLSVTGPSANDIKKYIQNEYDRDGQLAFVLLVGDAEYMPFHPGTDGNASGNEADPMYGLVDGDDSYPDIIVARFPAQTVDDVANMARRSIDYEKGLGDEAWQRKALGIASDEGSPTDIERAGYLKNELIGAGFDQVDGIFAPEATASQILESINQGRSVINYIGHGTETAWVTGWFENRHIKKLANQSKLPMIISVACVNGDFDYSQSDSFAEAWMKAGTSKRPAGAIAIFASSTNQSWVPPTVGQLKIAKMIREGVIQTIGGLMMNGSVAVLEDNDYTAVQTFQTWHIFGDPTIRLRTGDAKRLKIRMPTAISSNLWVRNLDVGMAGVTVSLTTPDSEWIGSGISDENGVVEFSRLKTDLLKGPVSVTYSAANVIPQTTQIVFD